MVLGRQSVNTPLAEASGADKLKTPFSQIELIFLTCFTFILFYFGGKR